MFHTRRETRPNGRLTSKVGALTLPRTDGRGRRGENAPNAPRIRRNVPWEYSELSVVWANPSMTAEELSRLLPGRTPKAVSRVRERYGRWRTEGFTPPCQRCGEHPVWEAAADGRRWGLCKACTMEEREYRERSGPALAARDNAYRQRKFKRRHKGRQ